MSRVFRAEGRGHTREQLRPPDFGGLTFRLSPRRHLSKRSGRRTGIYETKACCHHFRSCRNTGTCSRATGWPVKNTQQLTKADVQNVVQIISSDKAKTQAYCDLSKLNDQIAAAQQTNNTNAVETLTKQADALAANLGPQYSKMIEKLGEVDLTSSKGNELSAIVLGLDKLCT